MSLITESLVSQEAIQERLDFEHYRIQGVFETHANRPETVVGVVSDYINAIHILKPSHIFEPIDRNDTSAIAIGITDELNQLMQPMRNKRITPHSGEVYRVFIEYITDEKSTELREDIGVSSIPRALTLTLAHFILDGVTESEPVSNI